MLYERFENVDTMLYESCLFKATGNLRLSILYGILREMLISMGVCSVDDNDECNLFSRRRVAAERGAKMKRGVDPRLDATMQRCKGIRCNKVRHGTARYVHQ